MASTILNVPAELENDGRSTSASGGGGKALSDAPTSASRSPLKERMRDEIGSSKSEPGSKNEEYSSTSRLRRDVD